MTSLAELGEISKRLPSHLRSTPVEELGPWASHRVIASQKGKEAAKGVANLRMTNAQRVAAGKQPFTPRERKALYDETGDLMNRGRMSRAWSKKHLGMREDQMPVRYAAAQRGHLRYAKNQGRLALWKQKQGQ